jgi:hypothetical protein
MSATTEPRTFGMAHVTVIPTNFRSRGDDGDEENGDAAEHGG